MTISDEAERLLADATLAAFLATATDDRPHVAPVWYRYLPDDGIVEVTTTGRKLENIRANPQVALAVHSDEDGIPEWTVMVFGTGTVVDDREATERANRAINAKYGVEADAWAENTLVRIDVGSASARTY